jgi:predicted ATPase
VVEAVLVFRRGTPPDATYLFKHALVRDAAYESLLKAKRIILHTRLVDVLGLTERALDYWEQAGGASACWALTSGAMLPRLSS